MKAKRLLAVTLCTAIALTGCSSTGKSTPKSIFSKGNTQSAIDDHYRTNYEIFVYSFYDSDGDGIGDLSGITNKLDYLNDGNPKTDSDLGVNGIWLTPVCPSTTYHKYDVTDYCDIDPEFGTIEDYETLVEECHKRGISVTFDFVMNHTSSKHPWFTQAVDYLKTLPEEATEADIDTTACPYAGYYNFSKEAKDGYVNLPGTSWYYEARFWSEMPDTNLDNPALQKEFIEIAKFWLDKGVDGFRLDAVTSYYTGNPEKNIEALTWLNDGIKDYDENAYIVGEAWTSQSEYASYYASGVDSFFDFAFADKDGIVAKTVKGQISASSFVSAMEKEEELYSSYNENYINAPFYTNHDINRSAGYYSGDYASDMVKMAGGLNLLMSGNAFIYYGDEIGMKGSGKDENKRAPRQWTADPNENGTCKGPADMEEIEMIYGNLKDQQNDPSSIYSYYKNAIAMRNAYPSIARGTTSLVKESDTTNSCILKKSSEQYGDVYIAINPTDETDAVIISDVNDGKLKIDYELLANNITNNAKIKQKILTLPPYSIVVLK